MPMTRFLIPFTILLTMILAACGSATPEGDVADLPTMMNLPTETETPSGGGTSDDADSVAGSAASAATLPATFTPTATLTGTQTATLTPSMTITDTPTRTPTPSNTAPYVPGLMDILAGTAKAATVLPFDFLPTPTATPIGFVPTATLVLITTDTSTTCTEPPSAGFASIYFSSSLVQQMLGCPTPNTVMVGTPAAVQNFQGGQMIWVQGAQNTIYVIFNNGTYQRYVDTWVSGETSPISTPAPAGLFEPVRGFGKVWRENAFVRDTLGWATNLETATSANRQDFATGTMLNVIARNDTLVLGAATGTWQPFAGNY